MEELYYWMVFHLTLIKTNKTPAFNSVIIISVLQGINLSLIDMLFKYFFNIDFFENLSSELLGLLMFIVLFLINIVFLYSKRNDIIKKFENYSVERRLRGRLFFWIYVVLSFVSFFGTASVLVVPK